MVRPVEISDLIVRFDPDTYAQMAVPKRAVLAALEAAGDRRAMRIVNRIPERNGYLDQDYVKHLLVSVHCEIQRLAEEFQHGRRILAILVPLIAALPASVPRPLRIVDIGCGTGYVLRWLARFESLGADVELVGVDFNRDLIEEAAHLATRESLNVRFEHGDALRREGDAAAIFISTGVLHHIEPDRLAEFFARQRESQAVVHVDFRPSRLAWLGSWTFHQLRMRHPLSRHDGVVSAQRAYEPAILLRAVAQGLPDFTASIRGNRSLAAFQTLVATSPGVVA